MSESPPDPNASEAPLGFHSRDAVDVIFDGPGDKTVRPASLEALPRLLAIRLQMENPTRSIPEILAELSRLSPAELEKLRDELRQRKPGPQPSP